MKEGNNDNDELSFITLSAATKNVVRYLVDKQKDEDGQRQTGRERTDEQRAEEQRRYVDQRLRELAAFERKVSGRN